MKKEYGICKKCEDSAVIVNRTHWLCESCNRERIAMQKTSVVIKKKKFLNPKSSALSKGELLYAQTKAKKREDMIEKGYFRCFFSNKPLDPSPNAGEPWHHALGRKGSLLYEYKNIFPCIHEYHMQYHDLDIKELMKTEWYPKFFTRVKQLNKNVYNKELRRMNKGGIIDDEQYFKMFLT
jgi:hypothetical protein